MKSSLHILHLEDHPNDAMLAQAVLEAEGILCVVRTVHNKATFETALEHGSIDLILSDFSLPGFGGLAALAIAHEKWPEIPFIFVSGTLGEQRAIDSLKSGATDYVLKGHLVRLAPAVRRAMKEVEERAERRQLEARSIESQKVDVIGQLAGGIAHDFNNLLGVIMGYSDLLAGELGPKNPLQSYNEKIRHASDRAAGLTRQLLVFSRKQTIVPVILDLNSEVQDMEKMLRRLVDENVEVTIILDENLGRIKADSGYVGQVLMNMAVNARDAMPDGGKLKIATSNVVLDEMHVALNPTAKAGSYVLLSISDSGTGMTDAVKARLFEPFFTTKPVGKGTGLGLATCRTIVQQSGGHIEIQSELGHGTTFKIYFPRLTNPSDIPARAEALGPWPTGTETLLIVEDDLLVRNLACAVLEAQGYKILQANNGQDALQIINKPTESPIKLVVTDVIMPLMGGKAMADWITVSHPNLKILFTSGYTDDAIAHHGVLDEGVEFLPKPYTPATLTSKVRELLDQIDKFPTVSKA